jgi:hypothetical protein
MARGLLAGLAALLIGQGSTFAQEFDSRPACEEECQADNCGFWGSGEYLLWWFKNGTIPPLATAGGDGKLGSPGTQILVDDLDFDGEFRQGGRFALGYRFERRPCLGVEAGYFFLADRQSVVRFSSTGNPVLAQPFVNAVSGLPDAARVADPGNASGTVAVGARTSLWGVEANLSARLIRSEQFRLAALGGFRFLRLEDDVTSEEAFLVSPNLPPTMGGGSRVFLRDEFQTVNNFYGGQVGLESGVQFGRLAVDLRGKVALGQMQQAADVDGATIRLSPDGATTVVPPGGGLYALQSNSGRHRRDALAFVPEVGLNVGYQVTPRAKVFAGYSLLWVSTVARAGEQIDPVVNVALFPIRGTGPRVPVRPAFEFDGNDFWAQGVNFGLELRF